MRIFTVHLNVEAYDEETRSADEIADAILAALSTNTHWTRNLAITVPLVEELSAQEVEDWETGA